MRFALFLWVAIADCCASIVELCSQQRAMKRASCAMRGGVGKVAKASLSAVSVLSCMMACALAGQLLSVLGVMHC
jgi:hypothetical protein